LKDDRPGEWLWEEWIGEGYESDYEDTIVYVTYDEVDVTHELVRRALASCLQRDGVSDSLSDSFRMLETSKTTRGYVGFIEGEKYPVVTDEFGETFDGDDTDYLSQATWVEIAV
jgi:hypothetical protein